MLINRCDHIDEESRMQCNQEAFAKFEGSRQQLCKLHTFMALNQIDDEETIETIGPMSVINEVDKPDFDALLDSTKRRFHTPEESDAKTDDPAPVQSESDKEEESKPIEQREDEAKNRSDVTKNEVKD